MTRKALLLVPALLVLLSALAMPTPAKASGVRVILGGPVYHHHHHHHHHHWHH